MGSVMTKEGRRSARIAALRPKIQELLGIESGKTSKLEELTIENAAEVAGVGVIEDRFLEKKDGGRKRPLRGGGLLGDKLKEITNDIVTRAQKALERTEKDAVAALAFLQSGGNELANASAKLGRLSVMAAAAGAGVAIIEGAVKYTPGPTWTQLGGGALAFINMVVKDLPIAVGTAAVTNPVVALALATALMKLRAQYSNRTVKQVLESDASVIASFATGEVQRFNAELDNQKFKDGKKFAAIMKEIAKNVKPKFSEEEEDKKRSAEAGTPAPDDEADSDRRVAELLVEMKNVPPPPSAAAGEGNGPASVAQAPPTSSRRSSRVLRFSSTPAGTSTVAPPPAAAAPPGGRRKTKKGKKSKRRVTQRNIKFAY
jgi:hypothetical protein